jgi:hypothetical protein
MLDQIQALDDRDLKRCKLVLLTVIIIKESLRLEELNILFSLPKEITDKKNIVTKVVNMCGSFLTI